MGVYIDYNEQARKEIVRIYDEYPHWNLRCGALEAWVKHYAAMTQAKSEQMRKPVELVENFFDRHPSPEEIRDLFLEIHDHLTRRNQYLNGSPMCDLSDCITQIEDAIFEAKQEEAA